jgi:hypothetical protein
VGVWDAQTKARDARDKIRQGVDPIAEAQAARSALLAARATEITFEQAAVKYIAAHENGWRNSKHAMQWRNTLKEYAYPHVGKLQVRHVGLPRVLAVLEHIWQTIMVRFDDTDRSVVTQWVAL